jgi:SulP family sulfate permease
MAAIFYTVIGAAGLDLGKLRDDGWLFNLGSASQESWYKFYTYFGVSHAFSGTGDREQ